jgi:hypothetical protein
MAGGRAMAENQEHPGTAPVEPTPVGWAFWLQWVLATVVGSLPGLVGAIAALFVPVMTLGMFANFETLPTWIVVFVSAGSAIGAAAVGTTVGIAQRIVLRHHSLETRYWIPTAIVGRAIGGFAVTVLTLTVWYGASGLAGVAVLLLHGAVVGFAQWLVVRRWARRAGWWILASAVGHFSLGMITGGALVWLLRRPAPPQSAKV